MQGAPRTRRQPRRVGRDQTGPGAVLVQRDDAVHGVVVLVGRGRERLCVGQSGQRRRDDDGVPFGRRLVFALVLVDQGDLRLRVLDAELRVAHEVVDGAARLRRLQAFVGRHAVPEGVDHTDLKAEGDAQ